MAEAIVKLQYNGGSVGFDTMRVLTHVHLPLPRLRLQQLVETVTKSLQAHPGVAPVDFAGFVPVKEYYCISITADFKFNIVLTAFLKILVQRYNWIRYKSVVVY